MESFIETVRRYCLIAASVEAAAAVQTAAAAVRELIPWFIPMHGDDAETTPQSGEMRQTH